MYSFRKSITGDNPFFYTIKERELHHENKIEKLFSKLSLSPKPNINAINDFIWNQSISPEDTFYDSIKRVPPGYELRWKNNQVSIRRWWDPTQFKLDYNMSFSEMTDKFNNLFEQAIEEYISDVENILGCELSGGFDSSSVFCTATKKHPNVMALTLNFSDKRANEAKYANLTFHYCCDDSSKHFKVNADNIDYEKQYTMKWNYNLTPHWPIWVTFTMYAPLLETILDKKIETVLSGQLGDHLLYGDKRFIHNYFYRRKFIRFINEVYYLEKPIKYIKKRFKSFMLSKLTDKTILQIKKILKKELVNNVPVKDKYMKYNIDLTKYKDTEINKPLIHRLNNSHFFMYIDSNYYRASSDKYGIKFFTPFANQKLIEFMLTVPPEYLYSKGNHRYFHAMAMKKILPKEVLDRRDKAEFSNSVFSQIAAIDRKKLWEKSTLVSMGLVTKQFLNVLEEKFLNAQLKPKERNQYWCMINIEYWYALNPYLDKSEFAPNPYVLESCKE